MTVAASIGVPVSSGPALWRKLAIGALFAALLYRATEFALIGFAAIRSPWELDYGEGIVWQQARLIFTDSAYGPIDHLPAIVFHYTPLYQALTSSVSAVLGTDELATGRAISLLSALASSVASAVLAWMLIGRRHRKASRLLAASAAGLAAFTYVPVLAWGPMMRVDMLAVALSLTGLVAAFKSIERPRLIFAASLCFVAAVYTKQTTIAAPLATFAVLLATRPKLALQGIAMCVALGLATLVMLGWLTDGGFYRHIFLYNVNRLDLPRLWWIVSAAAVHGVYLAIGSWVVALRIGDLRSHYPTVRSLRSAGAGDVRLMIALAYLAATTVMLLLVAKSGSNINYFLEWCFAIGIFAAAGLVERPAAEAATIRRIFAVGIPLVLAVQALTTNAKRSDMDLDGRRARELEVLSREIAAADKPVISDDMVLLLRSGRQVLWEPAIFAELASTGAWDERPFVQQIRNGDFAFFVTFRQRGKNPFDQRYNPAVADAIDARYPVKEKIAGLTVHRPREHR